MSSKSELEKLKSYLSIVSLVVGVPAFALLAAGLAAYSFEYAIVPALENREVARAVLMCAVVATLIEAAFTLYLQARIKEIKSKP